MASLISIQINGQAVVADNLAKVESLIQKAVRNADPDRLVVLPECFSIFGVPGHAMLNAAETFGDGNIQRFLSRIARDYKCYLVAGTTPIVDESSEVGKYFAASLVYAPSGECVSRYNKIHMFDVDVADATKSYRESAFTQAGDKLALFDTSFGQVAQSVCYDLRFADMFSAYARYTNKRIAPQIVVVPSAFTYATGKAHWHALLQARSIENQCFVVASNQVGKHADNRQTYGNSCIYSPWGECLDIVNNTDNSDEGFAIASFDQTVLDAIRAKMPLTSHKKERYTL
jgi:predicted amidohydrolase